MDDDEERDYRDKENAAGTEVKKTNRMIEESKIKMINESDQIGLNLDKDLETEIKRNQWSKGEIAQKKHWNKA